MIGLVAQKSAVDLEATTAENLTLQGQLYGLSGGELRLRVYERGAGETLSCGTGACAAVAIGRRRGLLEPQVRVSVRGGELRVNWAGVGEHIWLTGPAQISFQGHLEV